MLYEHTAAAPSHTALILSPRFRAIVPHATAPVLATSNHTIFDSMGELLVIAEFVCMSTPFYMKIILG